MTSALLNRAVAAGLSLAVEGDDLVIEGPQDAEAVALALLADKARVIAALRLLELASRNWGVAVIVGGRWSDGGRWYEPDYQHGNHSRRLLLGEVVGGDRARWESWVDRATETQLAEAIALVRAAKSAA